MGTHVIKKGLNLPLNGAPTQEISDGVAVSQVALVADDYAYMKPKMHVAVGDVVTRGQLLMEDRKSPGVRFTAPGAGTVTAIHRGARRSLISLVIDLSDGEKAGNPSADEHAQFASYSGGDVDGLEAQAVRDLLVDSGLWTALRARPHERVPSPSETCAAVFVTATDTRPHAPDPALVIGERREDFVRGLRALTKLTEGAVWLCTAPGADVPGADVPGVQQETFAGRHPAGLVGTHIHLLDPVHRGKSVWHVGYQDVSAIGHLFATGTLDVGRVVALAGPVVANPRLLRTRVGARTETLTAGELAEGENRVVSGSVIGGRSAQGDKAGFLGRYHNQIACLAEDRERVFLGWLTPGLRTFSTARAYVAGFLPRKGFDLTTNNNGSHRAMVPIGSFERVMPLDILPTFLLRAILVDDVEQAERLGALELAEEDLALCSFVSPGKEDYGVALRRNLTDIWKEG